MTNPDKVTFGNVGAIFSFFTLTFGNVAIFAFSTLTFGNVAIVVLLDNERLLFLKMIYTLFSFFHQIQDFLKPVGGKPSRDQTKNQ